MQSPQNIKARAHIRNYIDFCQGLSREEKIKLTKDSIEFYKSVRLDQIYKKAIIRRYVRYLKYFEYEKRLS